MAKTRSSTTRAATPKPKIVKVRKPTRKAQEPQNSSESPAPIHEVQVQTAQNSSESPAPNHEVPAQTFAQLRSQSQSIPLIREVLTEIQGHANAQAQLLHALTPLLEDMIALNELLLTRIQG